MTSTGADDEWRNASAPGTEPKRVKVIVLVDAGRAGGTALDGGPGGNLGARAAHPPPFLRTSPAWQAVEDRAGVRRRADRGEGPRPSGAPRPAGDPSRKSRTARRDRAPARP